MSPFIDSEGIVRVGGRLGKSMFTYYCSVKHPILLPKDSYTTLIMQEIHRKNYHAGPQTLLMLTRQKYWPIHGKRIANNILHNCVRCARTRPKNIFQLMGNLPENRVIPLAPFAHTGIDFAGPFQVHYIGRGRKPTKAYLAVYVCFSTKAVHLDLVSDLITKAFIVIKSIIKFHSS